MQKEELAKSKFHGVEKYNCTQAVLAAFQVETGMTDADIASYSNTGGGKAEGGVCGGLFAARVILKDSPALPAIESTFTTAGGSPGCLEIRKLGQLPCKDCVGLGARLVEQHLLK